MTTTRTDYDLTILSDGKRTLAGSYSTRDALANEIAARLTKHDFRAPRPDGKDAPLTLEITMRTNYASWSDEEPAS